LRHGHHVLQQCSAAVPFPPTTHKRLPAGTRQHSGRHHRCMQRWLVAGRWGAAQRIEQQASGPAPLPVRTQARAMQTCSPGKRAPPSSTTARLIAQASLVDIICDLHCSAGQRVGQTVLTGFAGGASLTGWRPGRKRSAIRRRLQAVTGCGEPAAKAFSASGLCLGLPAHDGAWQHLAACCDDLCYATHAAML